MTSLRMMGVVAGAALLAGCYGADVQRMERVQQPVGDAFTQQLFAEYRDLAVFEANQMVDWRSADIFARKALASADGQVVMPEELGDWRLPGFAIDELANARARLVGALDGNARTGNPVQAAIAQSRFDCWVEQQEENIQPDHIAACRDDFFAALAQIEPPAIEAPAVYLVFFDFDRSNITAAGQDIINNVVSDYAALGQPRVNVVGHTDTSGSAAYNMGLSQRRAEATRAALSASGIPAGQVDISWRGQEAPLVPTPDGVREPSNRRAEISFE